jgi:uncharacterized membrane protein
MTLLANEHIIVNSNDDKVILTNKRIHMSDRRWSGSYSNTLFLEDISSMEIRYSSNIILLILAGLAVLLSILNISNSDRPLSGGDGDEITLLPLIIGVILVFIYWFSRKHIISISPNGGKPINFEVAGMSKQQIEMFLDKVQKAKDARIAELFK